MLMACLLLIVLLLSACGSEDLVSGATLLPQVEISKVSTKNCGKNCTDYIVTVRQHGEETKYEASQDLYHSIDEYRDSLKRVNGSEESAYNVIVLPEENKILAISPAKNTIK
jgi:hypothetical protein